MTINLVLIPGSLATADFWCHQERYFQGRMSIHHAPNFSDHSISAMAKEMINHLPEKFVLTGFSLGGYIALELMRYVPHRIEKLILINSSARAISQQARLERLRALHLINKGKFDFLISLILKRSIYSQHPLLLPALIKMAREVGAQRYAQQLAAILNKPDHTQLLATITCPTLLIVSKNDRVVAPECSQHMAAHIKNSKLIYIENAGHIAPLEQPDKINKILADWIEASA